MTEALISSFFSSSKRGAEASPGETTPDVSCLTIKTKSQGAPREEDKASWIRPKYRPSIVVFTKEELHPTETAYLFFCLESSTRWVWENQVEKIAGETETLTDSRTSRQSFLFSSMF